jgi:hypothetical protein
VIGISVRISAYGAGLSKNASTVQAAVGTQAYGPRSSSVEANADAPDRRRRPAVSND